MADFSSLNDRLNNLEKRIAAARHRLYLHETPHSDHAIALDELTERYFYLQQELNNETANLEAEGVQIDSFEKAVLDWINGLTFNH